MVGAKKKNRLKKRQQQKAKQQVEEDIDYGATADAFFGHGASNDEEEVVAVAGEEEAANEDDSSSSIQEAPDQPQEGSDDEEESSEEEEEVEQEEEGDDDDDDDGDDYQNEEDAANPDDVEIQQPESSNGEPCTFDLRNLLAMNTHQINAKKLYQSNNSKKNKLDKVTIAYPEAMQSTVGVVNEEYLLSKAMDGCTQLVGALWQLPKEKSDVGAMVCLPLHDEGRVPRALPPPELKKETKWEKFARERGLPLNKSKRSQKVFDEASGTWMYRHGFNKANNDEKEWPIMEVKGGDDPYADPWEKKREAKRAKVEKNTEQRMRNQERAGVLVKGTTTRFFKGQDRARKAGKEGGNMDRDHVTSVKVKALPAGVPVDLQPTKTSTAVASAKRGKVSTVAALLATQRSTASMGRFDKMRQDEPERRKAIASAKKRKYETATDKKVIQSERERSLKVLKSVVEGGGVTKERDIRKGRYAKGETAYDYEFDDGLGASSFKKKKGRAGSGKAKKLTKKRIK